MAASSRRPLVVFGLILIALIALGVTYALRAGEQPNVLRVANQKASTKAVMVAAGVLKDVPYTVEWSEFPAAQSLLEAVGSGAADIGLAGDAPFIFAYESGSPIKAVGALNTAGNPAEALAVIVPPASPVKTVRDLIGKRVATTRGSIGHHILLQALERAGIPADRVIMTFLPPGDAKAAFDSGAVDAWAIWTPFVTVAINEGARVIVDAKDFGLPVSFDVAHVPSIDPKKALMRDFMQREAKALAWARANPEIYVQVLAKETGLPLDIARASLDRNNRISVPIDRKIVEHEQVIANRFRAAGLIKADRPVKDAFDPSVSALSKGASL